MLFGYHGRYRRVDLYRGSVTTIPLEERTLRHFLGGVGLGTWLLHRENPVGVDPFFPEAALVFAFSPLVGTPLTTSAKFAILAKSPLTLRLNDALSSSHFALAGKKAGMDALVLVGSCSEPSILIIDEESIRVEPAGELWGLSARLATDRLCEQLGPGFHCAVIGPAGERLVRYATISHDHRHAGRGGLGAVLGGKLLKAVAVRGSQRVELADPGGVVALARDLSRRSFGPATAKYRELGTVANLLTFNRLSALPTRNFQQGSFEQAEQLSGEELNAARRVARNSCAACTIGCEHIYAFSIGDSRGSKEEARQTPDPQQLAIGTSSSKIEKVRLEYESLFALGPLCGIGDRDVVLQAAWLCDELGLDTISTGATIAFAMECCERGLLQVNLRFGDTEGLLRTISQIARREGIGDLLAEGTRRAAAVIGPAAVDFAPHVKGLEIPGYEPRTLQTMALGFAVGSRGADHNRSGAYEADFSMHTDRLQGSPEAARLAAETEDRAALLDSLILCKFLRGVFTDLWAESAELLHAVTGWNVTAEELRQTAQRIVTAKKLFNIREGWTRAEDTLPRRFLSEGLALGQAEALLPRERLDAMIEAYYAVRGWTPEGQVPPQQVQKLGLEELVRRPAKIPCPR